MTYKKYIKRFAALGLALTLTLSVSACGKSGSTNASEDTNLSSELESNSAGPYQYLEEFSSRDLEGTYEESEVTAYIYLSDDSSKITKCADGTDASAISISGNTITITKEGIYVFTGSLSDGQIVVATEDTKDAKVQLVLDSVSITNKNSAAIYAKSADKVFVTLVEGSENILATTDEFTPDGDINVDGTIFSKSDLTINGSGSLTLTSSDHGIVSKDDLRVTGGSLSISSLGHGLAANDSVRISSSDKISISSGTDGIHVSGDEDDTEKGYLYIYTCDLSINAKSDAMDAAYICQIDGGSFEISAGDDAIHAENNLYINEGSICVTNCYEGLEGSCVTINGGDITINASDDGINAAGGSGETSDFTGDFNPGNGERPQQPNQSSDSNMPQKPEDATGSNMPQKPEDTTDSNIPQKPGDASDDNASQNRKEFGGNRGNMQGGGMMDGDDSYVIIINGGTLYINSEGDGIDSNGRLFINGGSIVIDGPSNGGNAAIDWGTTGYINGGTVIAIGYSSMAEQFSEDSVACAILYTLSANGSAGDIITCSNSEGKELLTHTAIKGYNCIQICSPKLAVGNTYTLTIGSESTTIQLDSSLYGKAAGMGGFGRGTR